jgi:hypothetical protein
MIFNARFVNRWICIVALVFAVTAGAQPDSTPAKPSSELIANGNFIEIRAIIPGANRSTNELPAWSLVRYGNADGDIARDSAAPPKEEGLQSLRLTVRNPSQGCGVANDSVSGFKVAADAWYDLTFSAQTASNAHFGLTVSIESRDGKKVCARATIPEVGGEWKSYTLPLNARLSDSHARLVITMADRGTIWLTKLSLVPRKAAGTAQ